MGEIYLFMAFLLGIIIGVFFICPIIAISTENKTCRKCRHIRYLDWPDKEE